MNYRYTELRKVWQELRNRSRKMYVMLDSSALWHITVKHIYRSGCAIF